MRSNYRVAAAVCGLLLGGSAFAQSHSLAEDAAAFGARESVWAADISPDGRNIVYLAPAANGTAAALTANLTTKQVKPFLSSGSPTEKLSWCGFVSNERLICRYGRIVSDPAGLVGFARLVAIDRDGSNARQLGRRKASTTRASASRTARSSTGCPARASTCSWRGNMCRKSTR